MAKYLGPRFKIVRRLGKLFGLVKSIKNMRPHTPGEHSSNKFAYLNRSSISSNYKIKLIEKQKLKYNYGLNETQLYKYYKMLKNNKNFSKALLFQILESRLDCLVYRLGFAPTIKAAKQYINHCHILVNNKIVNIPSFMCTKDDIISVKESSKLKPIIRKNIEKIKESKNIAILNLLKNKDLKTKFDSNMYKHVKLDEISLSGKIYRQLFLKDINIDVDPFKIIEYYSK